MKMLYVIRHAKSSREEAGLKDYDRPLNERGKTDAPEMGARLRSKGVKPDLIISSSAKRALTTAKLIAKELDYAEDRIVQQRELYETDTDTVFEIVRGIDPKAQTVLIFGHNPTFTQFVNELAGVRIDNIPTCGTAAVELDDEWKDAHENSGRLLWFDYPKNF